MTKRMALVKLPLVVVLALLASTARSDCFGVLQSTVQARVLACSSAEAVALKMIAGKNYTDAEVRDVKLSAASISIADVEVVADVEIITSKAHQTLATYKGKVSPLLSNTRRKYMILGTPAGSCDKFYRGKLSLLSVDDAPFRCCRDQGPGRKETTAQCLLGLPRLSQSGLDMDQLKPAAICPER